jgi:hypothetical protein
MVLDLRLKTLKGFFFRLSNLLEFWELHLSSVLFAVVGKL